MKRCQHHRLSYHCFERLRPTSFVTIALAAALVILSLVCGGCNSAGRSHVDSEAYRHAMENIRRRMQFKGSDTIIWPYHDDAALLHVIGRRGDTGVSPEFYESLEKTDALALYGAFVSARRAAGFSPVDSRKCTVYVCDDGGRIFAHADQTGAYTNGITGAYTN